MDTHRIADHKNISGYTLIELLIVIIIVAVLAAICAPMFGNSIEKSNGERTISNLRMCAEAARELNRAAGTGQLEKAKTGALNGLAEINAAYDLRLEDNNFTYTGWQIGYLFFFYASRNSGMHSGKWIHIDETNVWTGDWPWLPS